MIRTLGLLFMVLACLVAGCGNGREYDLRYPATLTVVNRSTTTLEVREIYSYPKSSHLFSLKGGVVAPEAQLEVRIAEGAYESVRQGTFFIDVNCSGVGNQKLDGRNLQRRAVHDQEQWSVTVYIQVCAGRTIERPDGVNGGQKPPKSGAAENSGTKIAGLEPGQGRAPARRSKPLTRWRDGYAGAWL